MYGSLFWIEWLDRLERVFTALRTDVSVLSRGINARALAALERSARQLSALTHDLQLLDRSVICSHPSGSGCADRLEQALKATLHELENLTTLSRSGDPESGRRVLAAIESAIRHSRHETALLLEPAHA